MRRFLYIQLKCNTNEVISIRQRLENFTYIFNVTITNVIDTDDTSEICTPVRKRKDPTSTLSCTSVIDHKHEINQMRAFLSTLGVRVDLLQHEKIDTLTKPTIYSSLVVAGIVGLAIFSHNLDENILEHPIENIVIPIFLAALGFWLHILIIYNERNT